MRLHLIITKGAIRDLREAGNWYENEEAGLGDRFAGVVEKRFEDILRDPLLSRLFSTRGARRCFISGWPYAIYYKVIDQTAVIIAVVHTFRDPKYLNYRLR